MFQQFNLDHPSWGKLFLRLGIGLILLLHGWWKINGGMDDTIEQTASNGWPGWVAYGTIVGEFIAPLLVLLGKYSRLGGILIALNMLMTVLVAHQSIAFQLNDYGGWMIELNVVLMMGGLAIAMLGAGRFSLSRGNGKWD